MKISKVRIELRDLGYSRPYKIAFKEINKVEALFVVIQLENGITGIGSAVPSTFVIKETLKDAIEDFNPKELDWWTGKDIRSANALIANLSDRIKSITARAAMDIALHDAFTQNLGISLGTWLGNVKGDMATSVTIGIKNSEKTLVDAEKFTQEGFSKLKVKLGSKLSDEIHRIRELRKHFPNHELRLDANQSFSVEQTGILIGELESAQIAFYEQPVPVSEFDDLRSLSKFYRSKIMADESCIDLKDAIKLCRADSPCGMINIKLMKSGGIKPGIEIANIAKNAGMPVMWGCNNESSVSVTAAMHAAYSCSNTKFIDLDGCFDMETDIANPGFDLNKERLLASSKNGLGLTEIQM